MSKSKKNKQKSKPSPVAAPATTTPPAPRLEIPIEAIETLHAKSEQLGVSDGETPPKPEEPVNYQELWEKANRARNRYDEVRREQEGLAQQHRESLRELRRREDELNAAQRTLATDQARLGQREQALCARELNAEAGFEQERQAMLQNLQRTSDTLRAEWRQLEREIAERRRTADDEQRAQQSSTDEQLAAARAQLRADLHESRIVFERECSEREAERQGQLDQREAERRHQADERERNLDERERGIDAREREVRRQARRVGLDHEELDERNEALVERVERAVAAEREHFESELHAVQARLEAAQNDRDRLDAQLRSREDIDRRMGQRTPEQLIAELDRLRHDNEQLDRELAERPSLEEIDELRREAEELESIRIDRRRLQDELAREREQSSRMRIAERELETIQSERDATQTTVAALQGTIDELRGQLDDLHARAQAATAFPQCTAMDADPALQREDEFTGVDDLEEFVEMVRQRMASGSTPRFYEPADVRAFVGGLAMGSLLLLQGISGTGKTSLPVAFAQAVGTQATVIEVQAGWRDPQDLIGHYNSFERRFYESELLQALYRAQMPRWRDGIHIVVLDEMNLAHPEQYFSDFLSALERARGEQMITLTTSSLPNAPKHLLEGRKLKIPANVWFVGTANHDETTKGFADKTYDRAHVMTLPETPPTWKTRRSTIEPISHESLRACFERAQSEHAHAAKDALECLALLRPKLSEGFQIGWGPRLERQLRAFVPVIVAAGGSVGEATDHILAYRLLRKLEGRYDNQIPKLERLRDDVSQALESLEPPASCKAIDLLARELRRLDPEREVES